MYHLFTLLYVIAVLLSLAAARDFRTCRVHLPGANQECIKYCNLAGCKSIYCSINICECTKCETPQTTTTAGDDDNDDENNSTMTTDDDDDDEENSLTTTTVETITLQWTMMTTMPSNETVATKWLTFTTANQIWSYIICVRLFVIIIFITIVIAFTAVCVRICSCARKGHRYMSAQRKSECPLCRQSLKDERTIGMIRVNPRNRLAI